MHEPQMPMVPMVYTQRLLTVLFSRIWATFGCNIIGIGMHDLMYTLLLCHFEQFIEFLVEDKAWHLNVMFPSSLI